MPGKPKGPLGTLHPLVLSTALRKILSLVTLELAREKFELYLSASRAAFRKGRSTSDIMWAHRWLAAKAIRYRKILHVLGLDMSRAFDTIDRGRLMNIVRDDERLNEDELRMCQMLPEDTNLKVKLKKAVSEPFETTIGTPQGDGFVSYSVRSLL